MTADDPSERDAAEDTIPHNLTHRFARLREALNHASTGMFGDAKKMLEGLPPDALGTVECLIRELILDYETAIRQNEVSIEDFKISKHRLIEELETVERQKAEIQRLSAPIIDVADDVVAIPLIGAIDGVQLAEMSARLLDRIAASSISWVIIDLTGIGAVAPEPVEQLLRVAVAVRLMGAHCLWTGIPPSIAKTLVSLETSVAGIVIAASLKEGLRYCARQKAQRRR